jgi:glycosyltransferase involved in cell wall biosynthesis
MAFPPHLPPVRHVVINSSGANQLSLRTGISSLLIPNVMDFDHPPQPPDDYCADVRKDLQVSPNEWLFLQPTRVVPRKGIEHAIELARRVGPKARIIVSHASGDEGYEYETYLRDYALMMGVPVNFVSDIIRDKRGEIDGRKVYTLYDIYPQADLVTYPSDIEGFGNAFLEAVYFKRPIVVNNYSIFDVDIKPKGFRVIDFDGLITDQVVEHTLQVLNDPALTAEMAAQNYDLARRYYSYSMLARRLHTLLADIFGEK